MASNTHPVYSEDFKRKAVQGFKKRGGKSVDEYAESIGVHRSRLYAWMAKYDSSAKPSNVAQLTPVLAHFEPSKVDEASRLRRENDLLREERDVLQQVIVLFARPKGR